jgi:hypothetical protein
MDGTEEHQKIQDSHVESRPKKNANVMGFVNGII